jgi:hypothetical protein
VEIKLIHYPKLPVVSQIACCCYSLQPHPRSSQTNAEAKLMKDKTETTVQGLVNLDGENIAIGSMKSRRRRLARPSRSKMFSIAPSIMRPPSAASSNTDCT